MDDIIARQKIAKRRAAPRPIKSKGGSAYTQKVLSPGTVRLPSFSIYGAGPRPGSPLGRRRGLGLRFPGLPKIPVPRLRGDISLAFRQALRSASKRLSALPPPRLALLAAAILAAALALALGMTALLRGPAFPLPHGGLLPAEDSVQNLLLDYASPELAGADASADQEPLPKAPVTLSLSTYTVRKGESLAAIARRFGLYVDTIISANGLTGGSSVKPGTELRIPNINGLIYRARKGDSLSALARRFKTDTTRIVDANDLRSWDLLSGQSLFIPGARLPEAAVKQALGQRVAWPLRGPLSSFFGYRADPFTGVRRFHAGIDIVTNTGTPVMAAMDGSVSDTGYNANYGNYVILSHAQGYQSLYGHLSAASVVSGSKVTQGSMIGVSGNTGYSTGPHLHFGLFRNGLPLNPLKYLK